MATLFRGDYGQTSVRIADMGEGRVLAGCCPSVLSGQPRHTTSGPAAWSQGTVLVSDGPLCAAYLPVDAGGRAAGPDDDMDHSLVEGAAFWDPVCSSEYGRVPAPSAARAPPEPARPA